MDMGGNLSHFKAKQASETKNVVLWWSSLLRQNAGAVGIRPFCLFHFILFQIQVPGRACRLAQLEAQAGSFAGEGPCQTTSIRGGAAQGNLCAVGRGQK